MTCLESTPAPRSASDAVIGALSPLVRAEARAEAPAACTEPRDLEQAVWVRLLERLEREGPPLDAARWVRTAVRAEARRARRTAARERPYPPPRAHGNDPATNPEWGPEPVALRAERHRVLRAAIARTPGLCPPVLTAMLSSQDPTYREIAGQLGISQGSLGPMRSRCLGCLRRMLAAEVAAPEVGGKER
ncbi:sigma-70 family RNA polymerase sigma factor [Streptomyces sp. NPDC088725]|uniref:sigma-70 family RNA polymerase sigma factor n=1 Tax=Streptomyces sp. NPDC088725 TaxID=3365873 RepID=UPI0038091471